MENESRIYIRHEGGLADLKVNGDNSLSGYIDLQPGYEITIGVESNGMSYQRIDTIGRSYPGFEAENLQLDSEEEPGNLPVIEFLDRDISVDMETGIIKLGDVDIDHLTLTESELLELILENPGHIVSPMEFSEALVHDLTLAEARNTMKVYMRRLRKKIDTDPDNPLFHNSRGRGYYATVNINRRAK